VPLHQLPEGGFIVLRPEALKQFRIRGGAETVRLQELPNVVSGQGGSPVLHGVFASLAILFPLSTTIET
jgi:hypothetical protein